MDYRFYLSKKRIVLKIHRGPDLFDITINKGEYDDIGLEFETFLMDQKHACKNKCIFCFIDQLPCGMRDTLYFKDDDSRLSFLQGNYITLTNLSDQDVDRIVQMHMTPVNISVHTTDPELRVKMMKNKRAGDVLRYLDKLYRGHIQMNCQIVLCRGVNDGVHLQRTMQDLERLFPYVESVSVVPSGLTKYRDGLFPLLPFSPSECRDIIRCVESFAEKCRKKHGARIFFCGDEMYVKAGLDIPSEEYYEGYPQIQNGVGMLRSMQEEFEWELECAASDAVKPKREISIATGCAAYEYICGLVECFRKKFPSLRCCVYRIRNDFFGENITVAGLVVGQDLIAQLRGQKLGDSLLIPAEMLRHEQDCFLDNVTLSEAEKTLNVKIRISQSNGADFFHTLCEACQ